MSPVHWLTSHVTAPGRAGVLLTMHTAMAALIGLRLATREWILIAERPAELTMRTNIAGWVPAPVPNGWLVALQVAGLAGVALVLARKRPHLGYVIAWSCYALLAALWGSSGKVMHNDILAISVGTTLLFASVPDRATPPSDKRLAWGWPPRAALATLATVYFLTGFQKLVESGPQWVFSENMRWVLLQGSTTGASPFGTGWGPWVADHLWLTQTLAGGALLLELSAPILLYFRVTRIPFALAVALMHTSIWSFMGLDYWGWVLTAAIVCLPTGWPAARDLARRLGIGSRPAPPAPATTPGAVRV